MHPLLASTALGLVAAWPVGALGYGLGRLVERLTGDPRPRAAAWSLAYALPAGALAATVALTFAPMPREPVAEAPIATPAAETISVAPTWTPEKELTTNLAWSLVALSGAGLLARGWRWGRGRRRLAAIRAAAEPCQDHALNEAVRARAARLGVEAPRVLVSDAITSPLLAGVRRPQILLPKALVEAEDARRLALVCGHELAHLRRGDNWRIPAEEALAGLFWLTPPIAALRNRMLAAREEVCDLTALDGAAPETRQDYARVLVEALRMNTAAPAALAAFTGQDRGLIRMRLSAILQPGGGASAGRAGLAVALGGVLTIATGAGSLALADQARGLAPSDAEIAAARAASVARADALAKVTRDSALAAAATDVAAPKSARAMAMRAGGPLAPIKADRPAHAARPAALAAPAADAALAAPAAEPHEDSRPNPQPNPQPHPQPNPQPRFDARASVDPAVAARVETQSNIRITVPRNSAEDLGRQIKVMDPDVKTRVSAEPKVGINVTVRSPVSPWDRR